MSAFNKKHSNIDMLNGSLISGLIFFALPIALSSMLQQLFNAADTSVVGYFANSDALAAVGTNTEIVALLVALSGGLCIGVNVLIARYIGEHNTAVIPDIIHTAVTLAAIIGISGAIIGQFIARPLLVLIKTPSEILDSAVLYLRIYFCGFFFLMLYDFAAAILRAKGDSQRPFAALTVSGIINVLLNLVFVIIFKMGVAGVSLATAISTAISAFIVLYWLNMETGSFHSAYALRILGIGIPSAVQGAVFCFANIFVQASVNSFGSVATAGSTIAMNFEYFGYYMITAFGQAATTFTSQNHAAGQISRCKKILAHSLILSLIFCSIIIVPVTVFRESFSSLFTNDYAVISAACVRIMLILLYEPICCFYEIPAGVLRGTGRSTLPAVFTVIGTCMVRIIWIFTVFRQVHTIESLFIVFPVSWVITIILMNIGLIACKPFKVL